MSPPLEAAPCRDCGSPLAPDADQCGECGGSLKPGWFCWACREFNQPGSEAACSHCGRLADNPAGWSRLRRQKLAGATLLALLAAVSGYFFLADLSAGRNVLSQKDGEFQKRVRAWTQGNSPVAP